MDFFSELIPEDKPAPSSDLPESIQLDTLGVASATTTEEVGECEGLIEGGGIQDATSDLSNWFGNLDEDDFKSLES